MSKLNQKATDLLNSPAKLALVLGALAFILNVGYSGLNSSPSNTPRYLVIMAASVAVMLGAIYNLSANHAGTTRLKRALGLAIKTTLCIGLIITAAFAVGGIMVFIGWIAVGD